MSCKRNFLYFCVFSINLIILNRPKIRSSKCQPSHIHISLKFQQQIKLYLKYILIKMRGSTHFPKKTNEYSGIRSNSAQKNKSNVNDSFLNGSKIQDKNQNVQKYRRFQGKQLRQYNARYYVTADITEEDVMQLKEVFDYYDSLKIGVLLPNDLKILLNQNGFLPTKKTIYQIIAEFDLEEAGGISFFQFMKAISSKPYEKQRKRDIQHIFKKYDRTNKGYITLNDIKDMTTQLNEEVDEETMKLMITRASKKVGEKLYFDDFYALMIKAVY